jgi:hypothetical protein
MPPNAKNQAEKTKMKKRGKQALSWWQQPTKLRCPDWKITVAGAGIIMKSDAIIEMI